MATYIAAIKFSVLLHVSDVKDNVHRVDGPVI